ncbi:MAG: hypothetical protein AB7Y46_11260 [Armatimonadota bacterium]
MLLPLLISATAAGAATVSTQDGLTLSLDDLSGRITSTRLGSFLRGGEGGVYLRDVEQGMDLHPVSGTVRDRGDGSLEFVGGALGMELRLRLVGRADHIAVHGAVRDTTGRDRVMSVALRLPLGAGNWCWWDSIDDWRMVPAPGQAVAPYRWYHCAPGLDLPPQPEAETPGGDATLGDRMLIQLLEAPGSEAYVGGGGYVPVDNTLQTCIRTGWGATGYASVYYWSCVSRPEGALSIAVPCDRPAHFRLSAGREGRDAYLQIVYDFALSDQVAATPRRADFDCVVYRSDGALGMRGALQKYMDIFPQFFSKRLDREGNWLAFTSPDTIWHVEDFHFAFREGNTPSPLTGQPATEVDHALGMYTFPYDLPWHNWEWISDWSEQSYSSWMDKLRERAATDARLADYDRATLLSAVMDSMGRLTPILNLDPDVPEAPFEGIAPERRWLNRGHLSLARQLEQVEAATTQMVGWRAYFSGYTLVDDEVHSGEVAIRVQCKGEDDLTGVVQTVVLDQQTPTPIHLSGFSRALEVAAKPDTYCVRADVFYDDPAHPVAFNVPFSAGTHDWEAASGTFTPTAPISRINLYVFLRYTTGTAWFDDIRLTEGDSDENLLLNPDFEAGAIRPRPAEGVYFDGSVCFEGWHMNYRPEHLQVFGAPLVYDSQTLRVGLPNLYSSAKFARWISGEMHKRDLLMMSNGVLRMHGFYSYLFDVCGTEVWDRRIGTEAWLRFVRSYLGHKPFLLLMNCNYDELDRERVEAYMRKAIFYGMMPSFFQGRHMGPNGWEAWRYFEMPELYNRDRLLFRRYLPVAKELSAAGWEPVTRATADGLGIHVERFGAPGRSSFAYTIRNATTGAQRVRLRVDPRLLGERPEAYVAANMFRPDALLTAEPGAPGEFVVDLAADDSVALRLGTRGELREWACAELTNWTDQTCAFLGEPDARMLREAMTAVARTADARAVAAMSSATDAAEAAGALDDPREQERFADCLVHLREYLSLLTDLAAES